MLDTVQNGLEAVGLDPHKVKNISAGFWAAIAGAAAAGATVFSGNRIVGGLVGGAAMFLIALRLAPCCAGCAEGKGCGGDAPTAPTPAPTPAPVAESAVDVRKLFADVEQRNTGRACS
jgi:hypothetical protein